MSKPRPQDGVQLVNPTHMVIKGVKVVMISGKENQDALSRVMVQQRADAMVQHIPEEGGGTFCVLNSKYAVALMMASNDNGPENRLTAWCIKKDESDPDKASDVFIEIMSALSTDDDGKCTLEEIDSIPLDNTSNN